MGGSRVTIGLGVLASALFAMAVLLAGLQLRPTPPPLPSFATEQAGCLKTRLVEIDRSGVEGRARLCIVDEGVRPAIDAEGLAPGTIYTALFVYFDRPARCRSPRCAIDDLLGDDPVGVVGRMDAIEAGGTRKATFSGDFRDLSLTSESQVTLLLIERGTTSAADRQQRARRLLTLPNLPLGAPTPLASADSARVVGQAIFDLP